MEMSLVSIKARIAEDDRDRRRSSRLPVDLGATVRELGASGVEARVLNISETGFMAVVEGPFEVGSRVWLILPGRDVFHPTPISERICREAPNARCLDVDCREPNDAIRRTARVRADPMHPASRRNDRRASQYGRAADRHLRQADRCR